jgi:hypothetical protein
MWAIFSSSVRLFARGKLFRDPRAVLRQWAIGFVAAAAGLVALVKLGAPLWLGVSLVAVLAGALQPFLFKNLKYA